MPKANAYVKYPKPYALKFPGADCQILPYKTTEFALSE